MVVVVILTATQLTVIYSLSDFASTSPARVEASTFVASQESTAWYSFLNQRMVFIEQGVFFLFDAILLYTYIFFLVSIMNDLGSQSTLMYLEVSSSLEAEKGRLKIVLSLFGGSYIIRGAFDLIIGAYLAEYTAWSEKYPGFFELAQCAFFVVTDIVPITGIFRMHHQVYGAQEGQQVLMRVDNDAQHNHRGLQTLVLNVVEGTESSQQENSRSSSYYNGQSISEDFCVSNQQIYEESSGLQERRSNVEVDVALSDLNSKKFASYTQSFKSVFHCGLLSKVSVRQIQSDIVTVEALSRLHPSEIYASINNLDDEEEKQPATDFFTEHPVAEDDMKKESRLSEDVRNFNKEKNHFSKSTAEDSLDVRDLERLMAGTKETELLKSYKDHNNRSSSAFGSLGA